MSHLPTEQTANISMPLTQGIIKEWLFVPNPHHYGDQVAYKDYSMKNSPCQNNKNKGFWALIFKSFTPTFGLFLATTTTLFRHWISASGIGSTATVSFATSLAVSTRASLAIGTASLAGLSAITILALAI